MQIRACLIVVGILLATAVTRAQPVFTGAEIFPPEEFAARRARVMARDRRRRRDPPGHDRAARRAAAPPEQPVLLPDRRRRTARDRRDRRAHEAHDAVPAAAQRAARAADVRPGLVAGRRAGEGHRDSTRSSRGTSSPAVARHSRGTDRTIYTPFAPKCSARRRRAIRAALWRATNADPWDGRASREEAFVAKLKAAAPALGGQGPRPDRRRPCASSRARARSRSSARRRASPALGIMEAMRDARPGMHEYELQARRGVRRSRSPARYGAVVLRADRHRDEHVLLALPQEHGGAAGRRPGAVRLRARLQVLPVGRHAGVSRERHGSRRASASSTRSTCACTRR